MGLLARLTEQSELSDTSSHHPPITACYMWDEEHGIQVI